MPAERYKKMLPVSWDQLHRDAKTLAWKLSSIGNFSRLALVTRGGMVPGAIIARELEIRYIDTLCIASYDWQTQGGESVLKGIEGDGSGWLVIDDLVDTGKTARVARKLLPKAHFACLYAKPEGRELVDTFVTEFSQDTWILFPWDSEVQYVQPIALLRQENGDKQA